jgi:hypothetical protein
MGDLTKRYKGTYSVILFGSCSFAVLGVALPLILGQTNLAMLGTYLAVPMILASLMYVWQKNNPLVKRPFYTLY